MNTNSTLTEIDLRRIKLKRTWKESLHGMRAGCGAFCLLMFHRFCMFFNTAFAFSSYIKYFLTMFAKCLKIVVWNGINPRISPFPVRIEWWFSGRHNELRSSYEKSYDHYAKHLFQRLWGHWNIQLCETLISATLIFSFNLIIGLHFYRNADINKNRWNME